MPEISNSAVQSSRILIIVVKLDRWSGNKTGSHKPFCQ